MTIVKGRQWGGKWAGVGQGVVLAYIANLNYKCLENEWGLKLKLSACQVSLVHLVYVNWPSQVAVGTSLDRERNHPRGPDDPGGG